jgi:hypothetical protein
MSVTSAKPDQWTIESILDVLSHIESAPSGIRMSTEQGYRFEVEEVIHENPTLDGFAIRCGFWRPDTATGQMGEGFGRWNLVPRNATADSIVKTAWVAIDLVIRHEAMEAFMYKGVRIFDPHKTLDHLAYPKKISKGK